jgi:hypothetical protein
MRRNIYLQALTVWVILAFLTILFAVFREAIFIPVTGLDGTLARALLIPVGIAYTFVIAYVFLRKTRALYKSSDTIRIGILWLILTIAFEFTFGSLVMGNSLSALVADYNIFAGRTWPVFLIGLLLSPIIAGKMLRNKQRNLATGRNEG